MRHHLLIQGAHPPLQPRSSRAHQFITPVEPFRFLEGIVDPSTQASLLPMAQAASRLMLNGYATSTQEKYEGCMKHIFGVAPFFLQNGGFDSFQKIALFFSSLEGSRWSKVEAFRASIKAYHLLHLRQPPPFDSPFLAPFWHGLGRTHVTHSLAYHAGPSPSQLGLLLRRQA